MRAMSLVNFNAVRNAEMHRDPFDFLVAPGFIGPEELAGVNADYQVVRVPFPATLPDGKPARFGYVQVAPDP